MKLGVSSTALASLFLPIALLAHHSISGTYFTDQQVRIEGDLAEFNYRNPHAFVEIDGKDPQTGQPMRWGIEWASAKRLGNEGVTKETLKPGDHLVIIGNPSRTASDKTLHMVGVMRPVDGWKWGRAIH